jgi:Cu/Ag efflux protein CusF
MLNFVIVFTIEESMSEIIVRLNMPKKFDTLSPRLALIVLCALLALSAACNRGPSQPGAANSSTATKHYSLKGKVVSVDKLAGGANIDNEPISGFMDQMTMAYPIKPPALLDQLQAGDSITADLVVEPDNKYWLENVKVIGHSKTPGEKPAAGAEKDRGSK